MEKHLTAHSENIEDIINLRIKYLVEYNKGLEEQLINKLKDNMRKYIPKMWIYIY